MFVKMKFLYTLLSLIVLSGCSNWHYDVEFTKNDSTEQIDFIGGGYDVLYGEALMYPYSISYPDSARDRTTNTVHAKDFSSFTGGKLERLSMLIGFIVVEPKNRLEVQLAVKLTRGDGSTYMSELPINGKYKLRENLPASKEKQINP